MYLGKFHAAVAELIREYFGKNVANHITAVIQHLDALAGNPGNPDVALNFRQQLEALREVWAKSSLNKPHPTLAALLESIDARQYVGDRLFLRIEDEIAKNGMTPQLAASSLRDLFNKIQAFYQELAAIEMAFTKLNVEIERLTPGEGEIGISIPKPDGVRLLSDLATTAKAWNKALRPFVEVADPEHNPVEVKTISSSDWQFYLAAAKLFVVTKIESDPA